MTRQVNGRSSERENTRDERSRGRSGDSCRGWGEWGGGELGVVGPWQEREGRECNAIGGDMRLSLCVSVRD